MLIRRHVLGQGTRTGHHGQHGRALPLATSFWKTGTPWESVVRGGSSVQLDESGVLLKEDGAWLDLTW